MFALDDGEEGSHPHLKSFPDAHKGNRIFWWGNRLDQPRSCVLVPINFSGHPGLPRFSTFPHASPFCVNPLALILLPANHFLLTLEVRARSYVLSIYQSTPSSRHLLSSALKSNLSLRGENAHFFFPYTHPALFCLLYTSLSLLPTLSLSHKHFSLSIPHTLLPLLHIFLPTRLHPSAHFVRTLSAEANLRARGRRHWTSSHSRIHTQFDISSSPGVQDNRGRH